jgi:hypothetical protein
MPLRSQPFNPGLKNLEKARFAFGGTQYNLGS